MRKPGVVVLCSDRVLQRFGCPRHHRLVDESYGARVSSMHDAHGSVRFKPHFSYPEPTQSFSSTSPANSLLEARGHHILLAWDGSMYGLQGCSHTTLFTFKSGRTSSLSWLRRFHDGSQVTWHGTSFLPVFQHQRHHGRVRGHGGKQWHLQVCIPVNVWPVAYFISLDQLSR